MMPRNATAAEQVRELGIKVGDTIEGSQGEHTARLTLLWVGEEIAVWRYVSIVDGEIIGDFECADWDLGDRDWLKVEA